MALYPYVWRKKGRQWSRKEMRQARHEWVGGNRRITEWKNDLCFQELELHFYTLELLHLQDSVSQKVIPPSAFEGNRKTSSMVSHPGEKKLSALLMHWHLDSLVIMMKCIMNII